MSVEFQSKRDLWLAIVIWVSVLAIAGAIVTSAMASRWLFSGLLVLASVGMLWIFYGTRYTVTESELVIRSGPFRWRVPLNSITSVEPSNDNVASPASSLDRLEIRYRGGSKRILVSPTEKEKFCAALKGTA